MTDNWGRWGSDDQIGALNLLSADHVRDACRNLVRSGEVVSLAMPINLRDTPSFPPRSGPVHLMSVDGAAYTAGAVPQGGAEMADDWIFMPTQTGTHLDALAHIWVDGELYNGYSRDLIRSTSGAKKCGVDKIPPIVGRGVFVDVASYLDVDHLDVGQNISADLLGEVIAAAGASLESGDVVLIRTGWADVWKEDPDLFRSGSPGIDRTAADYLIAHDVAAVGSDNQAVEVIPWDGDGHRAAAPVHLRLVRDAGIHLMELMALNRLVDVASKPFLFVAAPLPIKGAVGSPLNPVAIL